ncbi:MAG: hypothetical protein WKG00_03285 [Polyangiaceae bacterium]
MTQGFVEELSDGDKDPGFFGKTKYGQGASSAGARYVCLLVGLKGVGGSIVADAAGVAVTTPEEVDAVAGAGELAGMGHAALRVLDGSGVTLMLAAPTPAGGAVAAAATITRPGTATAAAEWKYRSAGVEISGGTSATSTPTQVAAAVVAAITARPRMRVSAANVAGVVTVTDKSPGARGLDLILVQDKSKLTSGGLDSAIAGGAATSNGGVRFTGGSGVEDVTALLANLFPGRYNRIGAAQIDATNAGKWELQLDDKAGSSQNRTEHIVFATNVALQSTATSLAQTTLNEQRAAVIRMRNAETPAPEIAAIVAAKRALYEQDDPNRNWDDEVLPGIYPATAETDIPSRAVRIVSLDAGVTELKTVGSTVLIVRGITTRSLTDAGAIDDRTIDWGDAVTPDWIRDDVKLYWETEFKPANPHNEDDALPGAPDPLSGIATPRLWNDILKGRMATYQLRRMVTRIAQNPPKTIFNRNAKRLAFRLPIVVLPKAHQIEGSFEQVPYNSAQ